MRTNSRSLFSAVLVAVLLSLTSAKCYAAEYKCEYAVSTERVYEATLEVAQEHYKLDKKSVDAAGHTFKFKTGVGMRSWGLVGDGTVINAESEGHSVLILKIHSKAGSLIEPTTDGAVGQTGKKFLDAVQLKSVGGSRPIRGNKGELQN